MTPKYIFSVDAESDGLYGSIWAVGAVVVDAVSGVEVDHLAVISPDAESCISSQWVKDNILAKVDFSKFERGNPLDVFWKFWTQYRETSLAIADFQTPVEARLFRDCILLDSGRTFWGPYPLHELGTLLLAAGVDPDTDRIQYSGCVGMTKHHPLDDARVAAVCWRKAWRAIHDGGVW